jgi:PAS domain S-box-containing protein
MTKDPGTVAELAEQLERFKALAQSVPDLLYYYRLVPEPGFDFVSPSAEALTGYTPEEHYADPQLGLKIVHPDDRPLLSSLARGERFEPVELRWVRKDGSVFWAEQRNVPIRDATGALVGIQGIARDVTERKRGEQEQVLLARTGELLASSLDIEATLKTVAKLAVPLLGDFCIVDLDLGQGIRRVEVAAAARSDTELAARIKDFPIDRSRPYLASAALDSGKTHLLEDVSDEHLRQIAQGPGHLELLRGLRPRSVLALPLLAPQAPPGVLILVRSRPASPPDAREVRLAQELARRCALGMQSAALYRREQQAVAAREMLMSVVAHDLRNPLQSILLQADLLEARGCEATSLAARVKTIRGSCARTLRLVDDLLDLTQLQSGGAQLNRQPVPLPELLEELRELEAELASAGQLDFQVRLAPELPPAFADRTRVLQVLENLVSNALKFTPPGGTIRVSAEPGPTPEQVLLAVSDTGEGIAPELLPRVFDTFWQADERDGGGLGLGLTICKRLVEAHGGKLWVRSTPGEGTTFYFTLPARPSAADAAQDHHP